MAWLRPHSLEAQFGPQTPQLFLSCPSTFPAALQTLAAPVAHGEKLRLLWLELMNEAVPPHGRLPGPLA